MNNENKVDTPIPSQKKSSGPFRIIGRFIAFIVILFIVFLITASGLAYYYQDEVKGYVITELNKQLNTEIIVDGKDIDLTIIKSFPFASVDFKNVKALDATKDKKKDTLFTANKISLQFNIVDIFHKNYHIKRIEINDADVDIRIDKNGNDNYHFWKSVPETDTSKFSFALEEIVLNQVEFSYKNYRSKQNINLLIINSKLSGKFSESTYSLETESDLFINKIKLGGITYLRKKNIRAEIDLYVDNTILSYKIKNGKIQIEDLLFEVVGNVLESEKELIVNLGIKGKDMDIRSVLSIIPDQYKDRVNDYESSGAFYFDAIIKGTLSDNKTPFMEADFGINNADITHVKNNIVLRNVNLKGHYTNGNKSNSETSVLELNPFSATIDQGSISGELSIRDFNDPFIESKIKADLSLEEIQKFVKIDTIESITGQLKMDALFNGKWNNLNTGNSEDFITSGKLLITEMNVKIKNNSLAFTNINGDFNFENNDLMVNQLKGNVSESDFDLRGIFKNTLGFALKENQDITIEASLYSKNIDLNEILANKEEDTKSTSNYKLKFSEHINVKLNSEIEHISFRKFKAEDIRGVIILKDKKMMVDPIKFSTMNGNITISGLVDGSDSTKIVLTCISDVNKINVTQLFTAFENFTQSYVTDQNIKGIITAKVQFSSVLDPELTMDMTKLYAAIDMSIENGELNNVESMKSLSRFIELKELANIRFATLKNSFEIKNNMLSFPKMEIKSSALDIILSGTHTYENEINYKIKLSLNELLAKKAKKVKKENNDPDSYRDGEIADDGLGRRNIFLSMTGTVDNPIIKYDTKEAIQHIKQELKEEKRTLKTLLKEEFGLFKKDSTLNNTTKKEDSKFIIKWDEAEKKTEKKELTLPKKADDEDF